MKKSTIAVVITSLLVTTGPAYEATAQDDLSDLEWHNEAFGSGSCAPGSWALMEKFVLPEVVEVDDPLFDGSALRATALLLNQEDGEIFVLDAVGRDPRNRLAEIQACMDIVAQTDEPPPADSGGDDTDLDEDSDVIPGPENASRFSTSNGDHVISFAPFATFEECPEQARALSQYIFEQSAPPSEALSPLRLAELSEAGIIPGVTCTPRFVGSTDPESDPDALAHLVSYYIDPFLPGGASDGWKRCALSVWGRLVRHDGGVSASLYQGVKRRDTASPFSYSRPKKRCYVIRIEGIAPSSRYSLHGKNWTWSY